jgi:hypothetical protein
MSIELRFKALFTSLLGDHFKGDTVYNALTPEFQEIGNLAKLYVEHERMYDDSRRATFTFDDPFISSIYFPILKCRDLVIRRDAMSLLESRARVTASWTAL